MTKSEVGFLTKNETINHLKISNNTLAKLVQDKMILSLNGEKFPMFQFNGEALNLNVLTIARILNRHTTSSVEVINWFATYNIVLDADPLTYIKLNGNDETVRAAALLSSDIFSL